MAYTFAAVRGVQKSTEYYLAVMEAGEIESLVVLPEDFLGDALLDDDETMQRKLSWTRVRKEMKRYLLDAPNSFYSALTLFVIPRDLSPLEEGEGYAFKTASTGDRQGVLEIRSTCVLFPGDGQHRAASIKEALKEEPKLASMQVPVVLIPFRNKGQVRQLFSDLNLNAKPVNKTIGLSFETRDGLAIITKTLANTFPLFVDRTNRRTNSLPESSSNVITVNALYEANRHLLAALGVDVDGLRSPKETDPRVVQAVQDLAAVWEIVVSDAPSMRKNRPNVWEEVMAGALKPGAVRREYVFAFALGWQAIGLAAAALIKDFPRNWQVRLSKAMTAVDWRRSNADWQGVAMAGDRVNNTGSAIRATAGYILSKVGATGPSAAPLLAALKASRAAAA